MPAELPALNVLGPAVGEGGHARRCVARPVPLASTLGAEIASIDALLRRFPRAARRGWSFSNRAERPPQGLLGVHRLGQAFWPSVSKGKLVVH